MWSVFQRKIYSPEFLCTLIIHLKKIHFQKADFNLTQRLSWVQKCFTCCAGGGGKDEEKAQSDLQLCTDLNSKQFCYERYYLQHCAKIRISGFRHFDINVHLLYGGIGEPKTWTIFCKCLGATHTRLQSLHTKSFRTTPFAREVTHIKYRLHASWRQTMTWFLFMDLLLL